MWNDYIFTWIIICHFRLSFQMFINIWQNSFLRPRSLSAYSYITIPNETFNLLSSLIVGWPVFGRSSTEPIFPMLFSISHCALTYGSILNKTHTSHRRWARTLSTNPFTNLSVLTANDLRILLSKMYKFTKIQFTQRQLKN